MKMKVLLILFISYHCCNTLVILPYYLNNDIYKEYPFIMSNFDFIFNFTENIINLKHQIDNKKNFYLSRKIETCESFWNYGVNKGKCAKLNEDVEEKCGKFTIPSSFLDEFLIYDNDNSVPTNKSLFRSKFINEADFIVFISVINDSRCQSFAYSQVCKRDDNMIGGVHSGRPKAGFIEFCSNAVKDISSCSFKKIILHELIHLFAFSYDNIRNFIKCYEWNNLNTADTSMIYCWNRDDLLRIDMNEKNKFLVSSSLFKNGINNSSKPEKIILSPSKSGLHWSNEMFHDNENSIMLANASNNEKAIIDDITVSLLEASGWYAMNKTALQNLNNIFRNSQLCSNIGHSNIVKNKQHSEITKLNDTNNDSILISNLENITHTFIDSEIGKGINEACRIFYFLKYKVITGLIIVW